MDNVWVLIPLAAIVVGGVKALASHQVKMARIIHGTDQQAVTNPQETSELREEVRQLRELMHQQTIALDNLSQEVRGAQNVQERISEKT